MKTKIYSAVTLLKFVSSLTNKVEFLYSRLKCVSLTGGIKIKVRNLYDCLVLQEVFGEQCYKFLFDHDGHDKVFIDIGGYIGDTALYASQQRSVKRIIIYEPLPDNIEIIEQNIKLNKLKNVVLWKKAVGVRRGEIVIHFSSLNRGISSAYKFKGFPEQYRVASVSLEEVIRSAQDKNKILVLKCDSEGAEGDIFLNTPRNIIRKLSKIIIEYHSREILLNLTSYFTKMGFKVTYKPHPAVQDLGLIFLDIVP